MASTFTIQQEGKPYIVNYKLVNNMSGETYAIQNYNFYFNNSRSIRANGGGGISYGGYREDRIAGDILKSDFPLSITSYDINAGCTSNVEYRVNIPSYTIYDYLSGKTLLITVDKYCQ